MDGTDSTEFSLTALSKGTVVNEQSGVTDAQIWLAATIGRAKLLIHSDGFKLEVLNCGECEPLKLGVHGASLALAVVMGAYNAAAWLRRREHHLAINTVFYAALIAWEQHHVMHHLALLRQQPEGEGHREQRSNDG
jgi:hypothetical protein